METETGSPLVIDCDIHPAVPTSETLLPYLPQHWQEYATQSDFRGPAADLYPAGIPIEGHPESIPPAGGRAGSDLGRLRQQALDEMGVAYGILNCSYGVESLHNPYGAAAFASAVNDWLLAEWLEPEPRLRGSLVVPSQDPELAAQEIERLGQQPGFVQVYLPVRSINLYGTRRYHPIYRAAVEHNLVVGLHAGGAPGAPPSSSGWPSYYLEEYVGMSHLFQSQLTSMITEGIFAEFPTLKVAAIASGFTWLPSLMWRLDKEWKGLRREIPWVKQPPSDYIRRHVRFTLQPVDAPPEPAQLLDLFEQLGSDELIMFSTDYPYGKFNSPTDAFPVELPVDLTRKIMGENAASFYELNGHAGT